MGYKPPAKLVGVPGGRGGGELGLLPQIRSAGNLGRVAVVGIAHRNLHIVPYTPVQLFLPKLDHALEMSPAPFTAYREDFIIFGRLTAVPADAHPGFPQLHALRTVGKLHAGAFKGRLEHDRDKRAHSSNGRC